MCGADGDRNLVVRDVGMCVDGFLGAELGGIGSARSACGVDGHSESIVSPDHSAQILLIARCAHEQWCCSSDSDDEESVFLECSGVFVRVDSDREGFPGVDGEYDCVVVSQSFARGDLSEVAFGQQPAYSIASIVGSTTQWRSCLAQFGLVGDRDQCVAVVGSFAVLFAAYDTAVCATVCVGRIDDHVDEYRVESSVFDDLLVLGGLFLFVFGHSFLLGSSFYQEESDDISGCVR